MAVRDESGKLVMECTIETKAATILDLIRGLRGSLWVTFEEGTSAAWLYDLLRPHVAKVLVCDPRKNALLKMGNKSDRIDAQKLSDLLRAGLLSPVYHEDAGVRTIRELARSYLTVTKDLTRVMNRLKGVYRSWAIPCAGSQVYSAKHREAWLQQLPAAVRRRAEWLYHEFDTFASLRRDIRRELLEESEKHSAHRILRQVPRLGPIRVALLIALLQTPHRFRRKRQLWAYCGLALETRASGEYRTAGGQLQRCKRNPSPRGLNRNYNRDLKALFKSAATIAGASSDTFTVFYQDLLATGMRPSLARLTLARKIAAIVLRIWKKGDCFDPAALKRPASLSA